MWEHHRDEADWFLKADDDTYVILENLKALLRNYNSEEPLQFGHRFKYLGVGHLRFEFIFVIIFQGYMAGGSGYVLSKVIKINMKIKKDRKTV